MGLDLYEVNVNLLPWFVVRSVVYAHEVIAIETVEYVTAKMASKPQRQN